MDVSSDEEFSTSAKDVKAKVESGEWHLEKSTTDGFHTLVLDDGSKKYRTCIHCYVTYSRKSRKSIAKHAAEDESENNQLEESNKLLRSDATNFVLADAQSFRVVGNEHFQKLIKDAIEIGRKLERHSIATDALTLPTEYHVAEEIDSKYNSMRNEFLMRDVPVASRNGFACTFDFSQCGPDYGVLTLHYIDDNWQLKSSVISFVPFPMDTPKTGLNVVEFVNDLLADNGFDLEECANITVVTDEGSNMKKFDNHVFCACHFLNTIAKRITTPYKKSLLSQQVKDDCSFVQTILDKLQKLIVKLRSFTSIRESLGTCLHVPGNTRWASKLDMVVCFLQSESTIMEVVRSNKPELLAGVEEMYSTHKSTLENYCKVISPIKECITLLEGEKYVTISQYLPLFSSLRSYWIKLRDSPNSTLILKNLVLAAEEAITRKMSKWNDKIIYSAAYLDPKMRSHMEALKNLPGIDMNKFEKCIRKLSTTEAQTEFNAIDEKDGDEGDEFKPFSSPPKRTKSTMNHELLLYTSMYYNAVEDKNPLNFWKNAEQTLPLLSKVARKILCIPASSAPSERVFSSFKIAVPTTRNRLSDHRIQQILALQYAIKKQ